MGLHFSEEQIYFHLFNSMTGQGLWASEGNIRNISSLNSIVCGIVLYLMVYRNCCIDLITPNLISIESVMNCKLMVTIYWFEKTN